MIKRVLLGIIVIAIIIAAFTGLQRYRTYRADRAARLARSQKVVEEVKVTTIEGWTLSEIAQQIGESGLVPEKDFTAALEGFNLGDYPLIQQSKPAKADLEGFLFPDTYRFAKDATAQEIIGKVLDNFVARMNSVGVKAGQGLYAVPGYENVTLSDNDAPGLSFYQLLTLASIIEKEAGSKGGEGISAEQERTIIAGVFYNRLRIGQALQSDATIKYVTRKSSVTPADLEMNSPYNTYKYPGLPPTPISNPSLASIKAVLNPMKTDNFFFFHDNTTGKVVFSKTYDEHRRKLAQ